MPPLVPARPRPSLVRTGAALLALLLPLAVAAGTSAQEAAVCVPVPGVDDRCESWSRRYEFTLASACFNCLAATHTAASPDGTRLYIAGLDAGNWGLMALDAATGSLVWRVNYEGPDAQFDEPHGIAVSPDGARVYVAGLQDQTFQTSDAATIAFAAADGEQLWAAEYDAYAGIGVNRDSATDVAAGADGRLVFVSAASQVAGTGFDAVALAYDAATGEQRWVARSTLPVRDAATEINAAPDGSRVYVTGYADPPAGVDDNGADYFTHAFDASPGHEGDLLWTARTMGKPGTALSNEAVLSPDGTHLYVTGYNNDGGTRTDYLTAAYDTEDGSTVWERRYASPHDGYSAGQSLAVSPDGARLFVTGRVAGMPLGSGNDHDMATVAYDAATGTLVWEDRRERAGTNLATLRDGGYDVAVSPDGGRVYVTGFENDGLYMLQWSAVTLAYSATGARAWVARYDPTPGLTDTALGTEVTVSPDSRRVLTTAVPEWWIVDPDHPETTPFGTHYEFGLLAYDA